MVNKLRPPIIIHSQSFDNFQINWRAITIKKANLLILDDFGIQPIPQQVCIVLLQILEDRYEVNSTVICSQLPIPKWYDYLNEPTIADAILDRIIPKAHRIELKGKSRRKNLN